MVTHKETEVLHQNSSCSKRETKSIATLCDLISQDKILSSRGNLITKVSSLCIDSRKAIKGCLFFAIEGQNTNGAFYIEEAIDRGAIGVVTEIPLSNHYPVPFVQVRDVRSVLSSASTNFSNNPDQEIQLIGVTGTNGKTTVSILTKHLFSSNQPSEKTAVIGTVNYDLGTRVIPSTRTTPEAHDLCELLKSAISTGCTRAVMEVSSHGICQQRTSNLNFKTAVFLNLTPEHLDFHSDMEEYYNVKKNFITGISNPRPKNAIINLDDDYGKRLFSEIPEGINKIGFGEDQDSHFRARHIQYKSTSTLFELEYPDGVIEINSPMIGRFNVQNVLASLAVGWVEGFNVFEMASQLSYFKGSPGRLENVNEGQKFSVFVDYAHTSDALRNILSVLREVTDGRLLLVFGCGGDRDHKKRPLMTSAAQEYCDYVWATADNPRSEPLDSIFTHMKDGVQLPDHIKFVKDRRRAISLAIEDAKPNDCLIIAGKGHETYQEVNNTIIAFDDRRVTRELLHIKSNFNGSQYQ
ncbi:MAG: UDP-N-acetylmuramoyl-L-alanyl-D-glutamate--2,6-diaminopimelate ligase [Opitutae bacterium]|nr:UDP-N-acetylmuramoyl-L-alanyl-D-glutamate--2,6-diaminopimelate ligase [Opitutae bacterium]MBT7852759.1 UDP-N-acetylmuramoyl-L-alanyl-D-glutamate--2,6-diaminopimelate ligase [Opitutae bacterium]